MECKHIKDKLSEYIDGALNERESDLIETHLATCADCSSEYAKLKEIAASLGDLPIKNMPGGVEERLLSRLGLDAPKQRPFLIRFASSPLAAVAAVIVIVAYVSLFAINTPGTKMLTDEGLMEKSLAPPAEIDTGAVTNDDGNDMILADISERSEEDNLSKEEPDEGQQLLRDVPKTLNKTLNQEDSAVGSSLKATSKNYSKEELLELLEADTSIPSDYDAKNKLLLEEGGANEDSLGNALDLIKSRYAKGVPVYAEKAAYEGQESWLIIIFDSEIKRLLAIKTIE